MNALSFISIIIFTSLSISAVYSLFRERKSVLNYYAFSTQLFLAWWSLCTAFFFATDNKEVAWIWHKLAMIGWIGFPVSMAYYFISLTGLPKKLNKKMQVLIALPPTLLLFVNLTSQTTSFAQDFVMSKIGLGWAFVNSPNSVLMWLYLAYLVIYFGIIFHILWKWSNIVVHKMKRKFARNFIIFSTIALVFGLITDIVFPLTNQLTPSVAGIVSSLYCILYFGSIIKYDVFNINIILSADSIVETIPNPLLVLDENKEILKCNSATYSLSGYKKTELIGKTLYDFCSEATLKSLSEQEYDSDGQSKNVEIELRCKDGSIKQFLASFSITVSDTQAFVCEILTLQDITVLKHTQQNFKIQHDKYKKLANDYQQLALYDTLTGLPNRRNFYDTLKAFEDNYKNSNRDFAILFMDLDNFKLVNDELGHMEGDRLLEKTARFLKKQILEDCEFVARLGGDEFVIIHANDSDKKNIEAKITQIKSDYDNAEFTKKYPFKIGISIGYSIYSEVKDITKLIQIADKQMYKKKRRGNVYAGE